MISLDQSLRDMVELIAPVNDEEEDIETLREKVLGIKEILYQSIPVQHPSYPILRTRFIQASSLNYDAALLLRLLGLYYDYDTSDYPWRRLEGPSIFLSDAACINPGTLRERMSDARFWQTEWNRPLARTMVDIILFDRMEAQRTGLKAKNILIQGHLPVKTQTVNRRMVVTGDADYVIGYVPGIVGAEGSHLRGLVVIVVNKRIEEAIAYIVGVQQQRMTLDKSDIGGDTTYGICTDGYCWQFLRLQERKLLVLGRFSMVGNPSEVYRFIDIMIKDTINASPCPAPAKSDSSVEESHVRLI